jgi:hypothetical protein
MRLANNSTGYFLRGDYLGEKCRQFFCRMFFYGAGFLRDAFRWGVFLDVAVAVAFGAPVNGFAVQACLRLALEGRFVVFISGLV